MSVQDTSALKADRNARGQSFKNIKIINGALQPGYLYCILFCKSKELNHTQTHFHTHYNVHYYTLTTLYNIKYMNTGIIHAIIAGSLQV